MDDNYTQPLDFQTKKVSVTYIDSASLEGYVEGDYVALSGGFKFKSGRLKSGIVNSLYTESDATYFIEGLQISIKEVVRLAKKARKKPSLLSEFVQKQFQGDDIIAGGDSADRLRGWAGNDYLKDAGVQDGAGDRIYGGLGDDIIEFTGGFDHLYGEGGSDTFRIGGYAYSRPDGWVTIHDYQRGVDKVELNSYLSGLGASLSTVQSGSDLMVYLRPASSSTSLVLVAWIESTTSL